MQAFPPEHLCPHGTLWGLLGAPWGGHNPSGSLLVQERGWLTQKLGLPYPQLHTRDLIGAVLRVDRSQGPGAGLAATLRLPPRGRVSAAPPRLFRESWHLGHAQQGPQGPTGSLRPARRPQPRPRPGRSPATGDGLRSTSHLLFHCGDRTA